MFHSIRPLCRSLIVGMLAIPLLAACGGGGAAGPTDVNVELADTSIVLSTPTVKAGKVHFLIKNTSASEVHEMVVLKTDSASTQLPLDDKGDVIEAKVTSAGEKGDIDHGTSADVTIDLPAGHYTLICNLPGHFREGMHTDLTAS